MKSVIPEPTLAVWSGSEPLKPHHATHGPPELQSHPPSTRGCVGLGQNSGSGSLSVQSPAISQTCPLENIQLWLKQGYWKRLLESACIHTQHFTVTGIPVLFTLPRPPTGQTANQSCPRYGLDMVYPMCVEDTLHHTMRTQAIGGRLYPDATTFRTRIHSR